MPGGGVVQHTSTFHVTERLILATPKAPFPFHLLKPPTRAHRKFVREVLVVVAAIPVFFGARADIPVVLLLFF